MLGFKFVKVNPSTYLIQYRNGRIIKEGAGLSMFYYAPTTSLVSVPIGSEDIHFIFNELTQDFQDVTVQGQVTIKVINVHSLIQMLNYTIDSNEVYVSDDPKKLSKRIVNLVQVAIREELAKLDLKTAMASAERIANKIKSELSQSDVVLKLGIEIIESSLIAIKPNQETARALESETREMLLQRSDEAIYLRRNSAIEQERIIKENELRTDIAIEDKKREIMEKKLESARVEQQRRQEIREAEMQGDIVLQTQNEQLVKLTAENAKHKADANAYAIESSLSAIQKADPKIIQILTMQGMNPAQLIASSFKELAENADKIGQLNISPDLMNQLLQASHG